MYDAAKRGDIKDIRNILSELEISDSRAIGFIAEIQSLSKTFQVKRIQELLKPLIAEEE